MEIGDFKATKIGNYFFDFGLIGNYTPPGRQQKWTGRGDNFVKFWCFLANFWSILFGQFLVRATKILVGPELDGQKISFRKQIINF